jgi:hypothetical protein
LAKRVNGRIGDGHIDLSSGTYIYFSFHIIVPQEPGISVFKGAVLFGHVPDFIACHVMRYSYGTDSYVDFDPDEHDIS